MPYTGVPNLATALEVLVDVDAPNGGVMIDSLHCHRSGVANDEIVATDRAMINYVRLCGGPVPFDSSQDEIFRIARTARNFPAEGGIPMPHTSRRSPSASRSVLRFRMNHLRGA